MKTQLIAIIAATTTTATLLGISSQAQAATFEFGTDGIEFSQNTEVAFTYDTAQGAALSSLYLYQDNAGVLSSPDKLFYETKVSDTGNGNNGWKSTFYNATTNPNGAVESSTGLSTVDFDFQAGVTYTLGLLNTYTSSSPVTVYSTSSLNSNYGYGNQVKTNQQAAFSNALMPIEPDGTQLPNYSTYQSGNPYTSPVTIGFDNRGNNNDRDFQDFVVSAKVVPEPSAIGGLAALGGIFGLTFFRRRRSQAS
jgi:hypothetical protein